MEYIGIKEYALVQTENFVIIKNIRLTNDKEQIFKRLMSDAYSHILSLDLSPEHYELVKQVLYFDFNDKNTFFKVTFGMTAYYLTTELENEVEVFYSIGEVKNPKYDGMNIIAKINDIFILSFGDLIPNKYFWLNSELDISMKK